MAASPLDLLVDLIHSGSLESWRERNQRALEAIWGTRYPKAASSKVKLRAPEARGAEASFVPFSAYIHPTNPDSGAYGGLSFVIFPVEGRPALVGMVAGTQGLSPDEAALGRPGHARKMLAITSWLNRHYGHGSRVAWSKQDPTRVDLDLPGSIRRDWQEFESAYDKYGKVMYSLFRAGENRLATIDAVAAFLDVMMEERGYGVLKAFEEDSRRIQSAWFSDLMPQTTEAEVAGLLDARRFVILQGPPGTGKTRMALELLRDRYQGRGQSIQFHPGTTYESFIGGLAPLTGQGELGFRFAPKPGFLMEAARQASSTKEPYLLHIDEINRADLAKILGEAIYLFEPDEAGREIELPYDFGPPFHSRLRLPKNLHVLGTMNSADRSIAIVDVAVRRRFAFRNMWPSQAVVTAHGCPTMQEAYQRLVSIFVEHASDEAFALLPGHSYFLCSDEGRARMQLQTSLAPLLSEYLAQGYVSGFAEAIRDYVQWLES